MLFLDIVSEPPSGAVYWITAVISAVVCIFLMIQD